MVSQRRKLAAGFVAENVNQAGKPNAADSFRTQADGDCLPPPETLAHTPTLCAFKHRSNSFKRRVSEFPEGSQCPSRVKPHRTQCSRNEPPVVGGFKLSHWIQKSHIQCHVSATWKQPEVPVSIGVLAGGRHFFSQRITAWLLQSHSGWPAASYLLRSGEWDPCCCLQQIRVLKGFGGVSKYKGTFVCTVATIRVKDHSSFTPWQSCALVDPWESSK